MPHRPLSHLEVPTEPPHQVNNNYGMRFEPEQCGHNPKRVICHREECLLEGTGDMACPCPVGWGSLDNLLLQDPEETCQRVLGEDQPCLEVMELR